MAIPWSSCPHLYSTNGQSHVTISDAAIKVAETTMNLVLLLVFLYPGYDACERVRNFWINPYTYSRLSLVVAIKYIRAIFRFLTLPWLWSRAQSAINFTDGRISQTGDQNYQ